MTTYQAIMLTRKGGPEVLEQVALPVREPGPGEVRLSVRATGAGATDIIMRRGAYAFAPPIPFVPGYEVIGDIEAIGTCVDGLALGQRVAALVVHGGYAEKIVLPARELVPVPDGVDDAAAVALILNYVTAYQAIHRVAQMQSGQTALVTGASGGVGSAMLELLRIAGVRAIGAASTPRHPMIHDLGATPIDGRARNLKAQLRAIGQSKIDAAFDVLGGPHIRQCVKATRRGGVVVGLGFSANQKAGYVAVARVILSLYVGATLRGRRGRFYGITKLYREDPEPFRQDLPRLFALLQAGKLHPKIHTRLPLLAARQASELLERGGVEGKIVHLAAL